MFEKEDLETANKGRSEKRKKKAKHESRSQRAAAASLQQLLCSTQHLQGSAWTQFRLGTLRPIILFSQTCYVYPENLIRRLHHSSFYFWVATLNAFLSAYIPDPRFADYGKVELVFSEGPEKIPGRSLTLSFFLFLFFCFSAVVRIRRAGWKSRHRVCFSIFPCMPSCTLSPPPPLCPLVRRDVECCGGEM